MRDGNLPRVHTSRLEMSSACFNCFSSGLFEGFVDTDSANLERGVAHRWLRPDGTTPQRSWGLFEAVDENRIPDRRDGFLLPVQLKIGWGRLIDSVKHRSADCHRAPKRREALEAEDVGVDILRVKNRSARQIVVRNPVVVRARLAEVSKPDSVDPVLVHVALESL